MDLVGYVAESFVDAAKHIDGRLLQRRRRKIRRGEKMQRFLDKIDPEKRVHHATDSVSRKVTHA